MLLGQLTGCSGGQPRQVAIVDSDGDGIIDALDRCPESAFGARVDSYGCSDDADGDGVFDSLDRCPETPRGVLVDLAGCLRDSDGDGVADGLDRCAGTDAGVAVGADGCPRPTVATQDSAPEPAPVRLELDLHFATGTCRLLPGNEAVLARGEKFLRRHPVTRVVVEGHTDSVGPAAWNRTLSWKRAETVAAIMCRKLGLPLEKFEIIGYGESRPVADNATQAGRERNRRVVLRLAETR
ncbi:MAG: hypothetical protein D6751_04665 [Deltaproteobacteria bacterium]|nr:MAG: hypothetical protein D6751_04665 [Deltaproteobacteria bacterium]